MKNHRPVRNRCINLHVVLSKASIQNSSNPPGVRRETTNPTTFIPVVKWLSLNDGHQNSKA
jgi:hypothetical protein